MRRSVVGAREIAAAEAPDACVASHHATQSEGVRMVAAAKSQPGDYFTRRQLGWIALDEVVLGTGTAFCRYRAVQFRALVANGRTRRRVGPGVSRRAKGILCFPA